MSQSGWLESTVDLFAVSLVFGFERIVRGPQLLEVGFEQIVSDPNLFELGLKLLATRLKFLVGGVLLRLAQEMNSQVSQDVLRSQNQLCVPGRSA